MSAKSYVAATSAECRSCRRGSEAQRAGGKIRPGGARIRSFLAYYVGTSRPRCQPHVAAAESRSGGRVRDKGGDKLRKSSVPVRRPRQQLAATRPQQARQALLRADRPRAAPSGSAARSTRASARTTSPPSRTAGLASSSSTGAGPTRAATGSPDREVRAPPSGYRRTPNRRGQRYIREGPQAVPAGGWGTAQRPQQRVTPDTWAVRDLADTCV